MNITVPQKRKLFALARGQGLDNEMLHEFVFVKTKKEHISELTKVEGIELINALNPKNVRSSIMATERQLKYIKGLAKDMSWNEKRLNGFIKIVRFANICPLFVLWKVHL